MNKRFSQNLYRPSERFTYIGSLGSHFAVDIIEDYFNKEAAQHSVTRIARSDFMSWTYYWKAKGVALFLSLSKDGKGQTQVNLNVAICFLPEEDVERATLHLLRLNSSMRSSFRVAVLLLDITALEYMAHAVLLTPSELESTLKSLVDDALALRVDLFNQDLGFVSFPTEWFERRSA